MLSEADLFRRGKEVLGKQSGGLIAKLFRAKNKNIPMTLVAIETASTKENPREYIGRILNPLSEIPQRPSTLDGGTSGEFYRV